MLTKKQSEALRFMEGYVRENGCCPSMEEMSAGLGLRSKSGVHRIVLGLEERGFIRRLPHRARAIEIIRSLDEYSGAVSCATATVSLAEDLAKWLETGER